LSNYLNFHSDYASSEDIGEITGNSQDKKKEERAFAFLMANAFGMDIENSIEDREFFNDYFPHIFRRLDIEEFTSNPYYRNIIFPEKSLGGIRLSHGKYKPYEGFVCDDMIEMPDGRLLPQIGFFTEEFKYPSITENGTEWMTITPNEINTLKEPISQACGKVLTYGLGLGYYPYMISQKDSVQSVEIVEKNEKTISLFRRHILPQFPHKEKIRLISGDALLYMDTIKNGQYDFIFADLWHDAGDGKELYLKIKPFEKKYPDTKIAYWLEKTIKCYLPH